MNKLKEEEARFEKAANTFVSASKRRPAPTAFWLAVILIPAALVAFAGCLGIHEGGWLSLTRIQLAYALFSLALAVVIYMYGVGDWSRFEPPKLRSIGWGATAPDNPPDAKAGGTPVNPAAAPPQAAPPQPGAPQKLQGGQ